MVSFVLPTSKAAAWVADVYLHSQRHTFNLRDEIEFIYLAEDGQESINSPKNIALSKAKTSWIEPSTVFDQNYCGKFFMKVRV